jgi:hypothetical protein
MAVSGAAERVGRERADICLEKLRETMTREKVHINDLHVSYSKYKSVITEGRKLVAISTSRYIHHKHQ